MTDEPTDEQQQSEHHPPLRHAGAAALYTVGISEEDAGSSDISNLDPGLRTALRQIARTKHILVGCDYDGTLSPIVANPSEARPLPEAVSILRHLASLRTPLAIISGRALRDLAASRLPIEIDLVEATVPNSTSVQSPG